jgi:hypothetical protein
MTGQPAIADSESVPQAVASDASLGRPLMETRSLPLAVLIRIAG